MRICEAIANIKSFCAGTRQGFPLGKDSRDRVLWGDDQRELTGVVTCLWASADVIRAARERGANLIVCHESLFWNHGDYTDWLAAQGNEAFYAKRQLLDEADVCIWRFHDYIHSGVPARLFAGWEMTGPFALPDYAWVDGIYAPLSERLGFSRLADPGASLFACFDAQGMAAHQLARKIAARLGLDGLRLEGDPRTPVRKAAVAMHLMGSWTTPSSLSRTSTTWTACSAWNASTAPSASGCATPARRGIRAP